MPLNKVKPGDPLSIPAETFNTFVDAALDFRKRQQAVGRQSRPSFRQNAVIPIKNDSGEDREQFDILGLDEPLILPSDNEKEFNRRIAFVGKKPVLDDHADRFVILLEPAKAGKIGQAVVSGISIARVDVRDEDHTHASLIDDDATKLVSACAGPARILWKADLPLVGFSGVRSNRWRGNTPKKRRRHRSRIFLRRKHLSKWSWWRCESGDSGGAGGNRFDPAPVPRFQGRRGDNFNLTSDAHPDVLWQPNDRRLIDI